MPARLRVPLLLLFATVVLLGAAFVVEHRRGDADHARQAQTQLQRIAAAANDVDALTWRGLATRTTTNLAPADVATGFAAYGEINDSLDTLERLGVDAERTDAVRRPLGALYASALRLSRSETAVARRLARTEFSPLVDRLTATVAEQSRAQGRIARAASRSVVVWFLGMLGVGVLTIAVVGWRVRQIRRRAALAERTRDAERRLSALMRHSTDVVAVVDGGARVRFISEAVERMLGYETGDLVGAQLTAFVHPDEAHRAVAALRDHLLEPGRTGTVSLRVRSAAGEYRQLEVIAENHLDDPDIGGVLMNLRDVTERRELEQRLRHQAFHDGLTGLANRELFEDRLGQALVRMRRHGDRVAVLFIDLDDFKTVNDSLGHAVGDELLRTAAGRIQAALRAQDTAARFGGDEFAVLLEDLDTEDAGVIAERIRQALTAPVGLSGRRIAPSASFGIAVPDDTTSATELLGNADVAMYAAKERGKGQVARFERSMRDRVVERLDLTGDLTVALERDELFLEYQPVIELETGAVTGVEALVRWQHPDKGRLGPDRFIAIAEQTGLIVPLGRWVLKAACAQLAAWDRAGVAPLELSVNVATRQLADPAFPGEIAATLAGHGIAPERLMLEITENVLVHDSEAMQRQLAAMKAIGVRLAVDDFGTGYSALSYLQAFPVDVLKVDRAFVTGIDRDAEKARLVQGIVDMGRNLQLKVVAEGIEEAGEATLLRDFRSSHGQGYLFSRPVAADAIPALAAVPALAAGTDVVGARDSRS